MVKGDLKETSFDQKVSLGDILFDPVSLDQVMSNVIFEWSLKIIPNTVFSNWFLCDKDNETFS